MTMENISEMMNWLGENAGSLDVIESLTIANATIEFAKVLEPIYLKHTAFEPGSSTFLFKMQ